MTDAQGGAIDLSRVSRLCAFCVGDEGGNPAGVALLDAMPPAQSMQSVAAEVGFSETVFLAPMAPGEARAGGHFQARYFAPETEVPFCGHATIAAGAALGARFGADRFPLTIQSGEIAVEAARREGRWRSTLLSPPSWSRAVREPVLEATLALFGLSMAQMHPTFPAFEAGAGAAHLFAPLADRETLASLGRGRALDYPLAAGRDLMRDAGLVTIGFFWPQSATKLHIRNAFAVGGVAEDPATGAAAAALVGMMRAEGLAEAGAKITLIQGEDMGAPSRIDVVAPRNAGDGLQVSGFVRALSG